LEYLIAIGLKEEVNRNEPKFFKSQVLEPEITDFLVELDPNKDILGSWIDSTRNGDIDSVKYLGGNSATLLCKLDRNALAGKDISGTILDGANLSFSNLLDTNLSGTLLKNCDLIGAKFLKKCIVQVKISEITVSLFIIHKTTDQSFVKEHLIRTSISRRIFSKGYGELAFKAIYCCLREIKDLKTIENLRPSKAIYAMSFYADEYKDIRSLIPEHFWEDSWFKEKFKYLIDF
jgi:hypothetical protein